MVTKLVYVIVSRIPTTVQNFVQICSRAALLRMRDAVLSNSTFSIFAVYFSWLVAWHSGRTSVSDWRTFPVLRSTCS